jgi:PAS domain S-box-containing protein
MLSYRIEGERTVRSAMEILRGNLPSHPLTIIPAPLVPMFDWQQIKRWGLEESALPADAIILNKPVSAWERYKLYIIGIMAFSLAETALIVFLIIQRRRKKAAEEFRRKAEEKYRNIFEGSLEGVFETSVQGKILTANPALAKMLGYALPDDFISSIRDSKNQVWVNPNDRADFIRRLEEKTTVRDSEYQFRRKDGTNIWVSISARKVCAPDGKTLYYSGFLEDITERKRTEAEIAHSRAELLRVERSSRLGELTASLAHELNQPLAAILSSAQSALRFLQSASPDLNLFQTILQNIIQDDKRAAGVIRSLRAMMKKEEQEKESLNLNMVLDEVLDLFHSEAVARKVIIEKDYDRSLPPVLGDKIQVQQVVLNLIMNAVEASGENPYEHEKTKIILRTQANDRGVQVTVRDFGPGIDPVKLDEIWKPFFTTKNGGLGMGLSVSKSIIQAHGGGISAENHPDGGAMFKFEIPLIGDR